ncbi:hypothetical protein D3C86_2166300 [compost metagenome]
MLLTNRVPAKMSFDPCHELTGAERLRHIIIATHAETKNNVNILAFTRNEQDGRIARFA